MNRIKTSSIKYIFAFASLLLVTYTFKIKGALKTNEDPSLNQLIDYVNKNISDNLTTKTQETVDALHDKFKQEEPLINPEIILELINTYIDSSPKNLNPFVQKEIIPENSKIYIVGDIHGSFKSLLRIICDTKIIDSSFEITEENSIFVFTGDYTDRGLYGVETWYTLLRLKIKNPEKVFLVRGNHESQDINSKAYYPLFSIAKSTTFESELLSKYGSWITENITGSNLFDGFINLYNYLPVGLYLGNNQDWILFSHGGLDKEYNSQTFLQNNKQFDYLNKSIKSKDLAERFLWSDFFFKDGNITMNLRNSDDIEVIIDQVFLNQRGIKAIFRGHQHQKEGLKMLTPQKSSPTCWKEVVSKLEIEKNNIFIHKYPPIFTFSTDTEWKLVKHAFYGILHTKGSYNKWCLVPHKIKI